MVFSPAYPRFSPLAVSWRLPLGLVLVSRRLGGMTAVFNTESGDTHLLEPVAGQLLERMAGGEVLTGDALGAATGHLTRSGFHPADVLRDFHRLGLAEPFDR